MNDAYSKIILEIVHEQENIIGPIAISQANLVHGLALDWEQKAVTVTGDPKKVLDGLVEQYRTLFGQISVEVCKEAAQKILHEPHSDKLPLSLQ
jgi:hypothetical protein